MATPSRRSRRIAGIHSGVEYSKVANNDTVVIHDSARGPAKPRRRRSLVEMVIDEGPPARTIITQLTFWARFAFQVTRLLAVHPRRANFSSHLPAPVLLDRASSFAPIRA